MGAGLQKLFNLNSQAQFNNPGPDFRRGALKLPVPQVQTKAEASQPKTPLEELIKKDSKELGLTDSAGQTNTGNNLLTRRDAEPTVGLVKKAPLKLGLKINVTKAPEIVPR